jgi:hypothetical protein
MKNYLPEPERVEIIASFGAATFLRGADWKYELRGGSEEDRNAAEEWITRYFAEQAGVCGRQCRA